MKQLKAIMLATCLVSPMTLPVTGQEYADRLEPKWRALDRNADGRVSLEELHPLQRRVMAAHDKDADGEISLDEYAAYDLDPGNAAAIPIPDTVRLLQDLPYAGTGDPRQRLDIMLPANRDSDDPLPVVAYVHGGGWAMGSKVSARTQMLPLVASGRYAVVSIGYRLSWQDHWPAQLHDVKAGIRWIRAHAADHGLDSDRICALGPSAGGHLVAMLGTTNGDSSLEGQLGKHRDRSSDVQCVVDFFGPADLRDAKAVDPLGNPSMESQLLGGAPAENPEKAAEASPVVHVDEGDVPFLIIHGTRDSLVPYSQSVALAGALREAGVSVTLQTIEGGGHGDFAGAMPEVNARLGAFLRQQLYGAAIEVPADPLKPGQPSPDGLPHAGEGAR